MTDVPLHGLPRIVGPRPTPPTDPAPGGADLGWCTVHTGAGATTGRYDDVLPTVVGLLARHRPPATTALLTDAGRDAPLLADAVAAALTRLPRGHPRRAPVLLLPDTPRPGDPILTADDPLAGVLDGPAIVAVSWTSLNRKVGERVARISAAAAEHRCPFLVAVPTDAWPQVQLALPEGPHHLTVVDCSVARRPDLLTAHLTDVAAHLETWHQHTVRITADAVVAAAAPASRDITDDDVAPPLQPALGTARLEAAAATAVTAGTGTVTAAHVPDDPYAATGHDHATADLTSLPARLRAAVPGQDDAIDQITSALTGRATFGDGPAPDGFFLLAGPSGCGKSRTGHHLAAALRRPLIEVNLGAADDVTVNASLRGASPGYVGYTENERLLSTRIARNPNAVLLFNECEKAHPNFWGVTLELFDGTFTDAANRTVSTRRLIVVFTSNIGSSLFTPTDVGFAPGTAGVDTTIMTRVRRRILETLPPEVAGRLDIVVYRPLTGDGLTGAVDLVLEEFLTAAAHRGYQVHVDASARAWLARTGLDRAHGARTLYRLVRDRVARPLAALPPAGYTVTVAPDGHGLHVHPRDAGR